MAKDDYFSFGDEDLGGPAPVTSLPAEAGPGPAAPTLAADAQGTYEFDAVDPSGPARSAPRSRGDLSPGSSERRGAISRWIAIGLAIAIAIWLIARVGLPVLTPAGPATPPAAVQGVKKESAASVVPSSPDAVRTVPKSRVSHARLGRDRSAEAQRSDKHRSKVRDRAQRGRQREPRTDRQPEPASTPPAVAPTQQEYIPAPAEPEPAPESAPSGSPVFQDGSSSPEFGL